MRSQIFKYPIIACLALVIISCNKQKRLFHHVELTGRLIDSSGNPTQGRLILWGGGPPYETYSEDLGATLTNSDGEFYLKTNSVRNGEYTLLIEHPAWGVVNTVVYPKLIEDKKAQIGDIKVLK